MPAESRSQQAAAALALEAKRGQRNPRTLTGAARQMYETMSERELVKFASTKREGLPDHAKSNGAQHRERH